MNVSCLKKKALYFLYFNIQGMDKYNKLYSEWKFKVRIKKIVYLRYY